MTGTVPDPEATSVNMRPRLVVELPSSAALFVFVSPGHRSQTSANTLDLASVPPVAGDDPVNESDPSGDAPSWQTAGLDPPSCSGTYTEVYAPFPRKLQDGRTGTATLFCGNSSFGLQHILPHYDQFLNGWEQYGANWHQFVKFMVYDVANWSNVTDRESNDTATYYTNNVGFENFDSNGNLEGVIPITFAVTADRSSGRIITAFGSSKPLATFLSVITCTDSLPPSSLN